MPRQLLILSSLLLVPALLSAQTHQHPPASSEMAEMSGCNAMMQRHQEMERKLSEMDDRLQGLVDGMNAARGSAKVDRIAAVVSELVSQRKEMREQMMSMQPMMRGHVMGHMKSGMMKGMSEGMSGCPMMKEHQAAPGRTEHSKPHWPV